MSSYILELRLYTVYTVGIHRWSSVLLLSLTNRNDGCCPCGLSLAKPFWITRPLCCGKSCTSCMFEYIYQYNLKIRTSTDDPILKIFYCDLSQVKLATEWLCMALLRSTGTNSGIPFFFFFFFFFFFCS